MDIVLIGSGNVAHRLGLSFYRSGHRIAQVYNRTLSKATELATLLDSTATDNLSELNQQATFYLLAVSDHAIPHMVTDLPPTLRGTVVHTSGATTLAILSKFENYGVIYPPQSLSKSVDTDMSQIPYGIEANNKQTMAQLMQLMNTISSLTFSCDTRQRLALHIASVFANNFSNALFKIAYDVLQQEQLPFELIHPIILETAKKAIAQHPDQVQTGPASRNDQVTIDKHLNYLKQATDWKSIYEIMTAFISK